ncbi:MAG: hypothetical protein ACK57Q_08350, partial [Planctomycetota bacterium]
VAVASAVLPTAGRLLVLATRGDLGGVWPAAPLGHAAAAAAVGALVGAVLLPAAFAAFAAGACLGVVGGAAAAIAGFAFAAALGQFVVWPFAVTRLYPFMAGRPRVAAVQALCAGGPAAAVRGALALRLGCAVPFQVVSLYLSAARIPARVAVPGAVLAAAVVAPAAACAGALWRAWATDGVWPSAPHWAALAALAALALGARLCARRALAGMP